MSSSSATLLVFVSDQLACIRILGRANFTSSIDLKTLFQGLVEKGFKCYVLDLTECVLMDSTFLGVLAGLGLKIRAEANRQPDGPSIQLMNPNARITELLENLGVLHLFEVVTKPAKGLPGEAGAQASPASAQPTREEVVSTCLEAHRLLMEIDPANVSKFKEVAQFLAEDLKKIQAAQ